MVITLASWLCLLIILECLSRAFLKKINTPLDSNDFFLARQYIALNLIATLLLIVSIFGSISAFIFPTILLLSIYLYRQQILVWIRGFSNKCYSNELIIILIGLVIHSAYSSQVIYLGDTGGYHFGFIKWLSQFGVVPGLAHLEPRFGFGSSWLTLSALFNHDFLEGRSGALINGYLFLCCSVQIYFFKKNRSVDVANIFLTIALILVIPYSLRSGVVLSPSPDFAIHLLGPVVAFIILKKVPNEVNLLLLLSSMAFNTKLSSLPLLAWTSLRKVGWKFKFNSLLVIAGILITPICVVNFITSGYPLYPSTLIQLNSDWALSLHAAQKIKNDIFTYAAFTPNYWQDLNYQTIPFAEKIYTWATSRYEFITFFLIIVSTISFCHLKTIIPNKDQKNINVISLLAFTGIIFFMATAPTIRFGIQWLVILPSLSITHIIHSKNYSLKQIWLPITTAIPFLTLSFIISPVANTQKLIYSAIDNKIIEFNGNSSLNIIFPPPIPNVATENATASPIANKITPLFYKRNSAGINIIEGPQCWNVPIPCATMMNFEIFKSNIWHKSGYKQKRQTD
ncbi:MAG: hypothetical protein RLY15_1522 [Bacteroidota bacterium]|jgi:hypothetical protein